ncbi:hypothetical protein MY3296_001623 [Beauveria thailandica]
MATLIDNLVSSSTYNTLPLISQVAAAPKDQSDDLRDLRQLLHKHNVPKGVSVRLIHKHFDTSDGEVMVFDKISVPGHGFVKIMKPTVPPKNHQLRGIHYFVDEDASLQAYEYSVCDLPDMTGFEPFFTDFCDVVLERGLQRKFGLKLQCEDDADQIGWTEYEIHSKRGTIMFPDGMPMPDGDIDYSVTTEWTGIFKELPRTCKHNTTCGHGRSICKHCKHCNNHPHPHEFDASRGNEAGICLGGQQILPGTMVHDIVRRVMTSF